MVRRLGVTPFLLSAPTVPRRPKATSAAPPMRPMARWKVLSWRTVERPAAIAITSGNSTSAWPVEVFKPVQGPFLRLEVTVTTKRGPGERTPLADTITISGISSSQPMPVRPLATDRRTFPAKASDRAPKPMRSLTALRANP